MKYNSNYSQGHREFNIMQNVTTCTGIDVNAGQEHPYKKHFSITVQQL